MTNLQAKAARAGLGLSLDELGELANVSGRTITDFERGARSPIAVTLQAIQAALEGQGAVFHDDGRVTIPTGQ